MAILGQVWCDNRMGISPRSLGISLGFKGGCKRYVLMGISPESLGILMEIGTARVRHTMSRTVVNHVFPLFLSFLCSLVFLCANGHSATQPHGLLDSI